MRVRELLLCAVAIVSALAFLSCGKGPAPAAGAPVIKIGFAVKQPDEPWFQQEWKFAQQAADELGFELIQIGTRDGDEVLAAIDHLAAESAQGLIICTPDVRLGPAIAARAAAKNLKLLSVDDRFVRGNGRPFKEVPHVGISAHAVGRMVGQELGREMRARNWSVGQTAACVITFDELETARERTEGAMAALAEEGFPRDRILRAPQKRSDVAGGFGAFEGLLEERADVKRWLICGMNDNVVLGAVRATEVRDFPPEDVIGIGINGTEAVGEFKKEKRSGFFGSILLNPRRHGFEPAEMMFRWIKQGVEPPGTTFTTGVFIVRENYQAVMEQQGLL